MSEVKWIKVVTDIFEDEKLLVIDKMPKADSLMIIWFKLLCLAGKQNNGGVFKVGNMPYTADMFAAVFRRPVKTIKEALAMLEQFGMIETINGVITIPGWEKHQSIDEMEKIKEQTRQRVAEHRKKQKEKVEEVTLHNRKCNVTVTLPVTQCNAIDRDIEEDKDNISILEGVNNKSIFKAPTLEEVKSYVKEIGSDIDPDRFFNHYTANGWHIGKVPMEDWRAAVQNWTVSEDKAYGGKSKKQHTEPSYDLDEVSQNIFLNT